MSYKIPSCVKYGVAWTNIHFIILVLWLPDLFKQLNDGNCHFYIRVQELNAGY